MPVPRCVRCGHRFLLGNERDDGLLSDELARLASPEIGASLARIRILSPREAEIFLLLGAGNDNRSIARHLDISERTVKRHVTAILAKIGVTSRLQAGLAAFIAQYWQLGCASERPADDPKVAWTKVP
jgi:DNA-binding NarL/FixJ family response regulator